MTGTLIFEVRPNPGGAWLPIAELGPHDREGSISDNQPGGRDVILFRCDGHRSVIHRSAAGADFDLGSLTGRPIRAVIPSGGLDLIAELTDGQWHEMDVRTDRGISRRVRWTHRA